MSKLFGVLYAVRMDDNDISHFTVEKTFRFTFTQLQQKYFVSCLLYVNVRLPCGASTLSLVLNRSS